MSNKHLTSNKHPEKDLFICDVADAVLKGIADEMEHPFYSLSKKPVLEITRYEYNGKYIEITPSLKGAATIYDKDILIYAVSQMMAKINQGEKILSRRIRMNAYDILCFINRSTSGRDYKNLEEAFDRLAGTVIQTNISHKENAVINYHLVESTKIVRQDGNKGRMLYCEIELSKWIMKAIDPDWKDEDQDLLAEDSTQNTKEKPRVLTLHPDYFRLKKPIERRIYELARKHCGKKPEWPVFVDTLYKKSGSKGSLKEFRRAVKEIVENDHLPDYHIKYYEEEDKVNFIAKSKWTKGISTAPPPLLKSETLNIAKRIVPNGLDVHAIQEDWIIWWREKGSEKLHDPDKAFLQFCSKKYLS